MLENNRIRIPSLREKQAIDAARARGASWKEAVDAEYLAALAVSAANRAAKKRGLNRRIGTAEVTANRHPETWVIAEKIDSPAAARAYGKTVGEEVI